MPFLLFDLKCREYGVQGFPPASNHYFIWLRASAQRGRNRQGVECGHVVSTRSHHVVRIPTIAIAPLVVICR